MNDTQRENFDPHQAGHEPDTISARSVAWTSVALSLTVAVAVALMAMLLYTMNVLSPVTEKASLVELPPPTKEGPSLNPDQPRQLEDLRRQENERLENYAWIDREQGVARIPIKRAMGILSQRGLPAPKPEKDSNDGNAPNQ
ncbi:MAG: hypothetical protein DWQ37_02870 [Planctomycetota bacterium]|nr:MAG: hypothetical protein DWQ37_02870 [Planctomycetota bacterium]